MPKQSPSSKLINVNKTRKLTLFFPSGNLNIAVHQFAAYRFISTEEPVNPLSKSILVLQKWIHWNVNISQLTLYQTSFEINHPPVGSPSPCEPPTNQMTWTGWASHTETAAGTCWNFLVPLQIHEFDKTTLGQKHWWRLFWDPFF